MSSKIITMCDICKYEIKKDFKTVSIYHKTMDCNSNNIYDMCIERRNFCF